MSTSSSYAMFTPAGNAALGNLFAHLQQGQAIGLSERDLLTFFQPERVRIAACHPEVTDTAVRESLYDELTRRGMPASLIGSVALPLP